MVCTGKPWPFIVYFGHVLERKRNTYTHVQKPDLVRLCSIGIPIVDIKRSQDLLISTMGIPVLIRRHLYIESSQSLVAPEIVTTTTPGATTEDNVGIMTPLGFQRIKLNCQLQIPVILKRNLYVLSAKYLLPGTAIPLSVRFGSF